MSENMTAQEAIKWLERNKKYLRAINRDSAGLIIAIDMAIEAMRASEPRVMQKDELYAIKEPTPVWVEHKTHTSINSWRIWGFIANPGWPGEWRCWTHDPTAEQMQATPWKESETE